ncbi:MAG: hypothetical protein E7469_02675 [Ruminococcaceae bacterium]|nr:hypothetical protein [Oscillospiraceae bacterium]
MKYIVMECYPSFVILLDEDGRFHKAANLHYAVGDTVTEPVLMRQHRLRRRKASPWAYAAGALAACLTLLLGLLVYQLFMYPVSSIVLRMNPEVRMDLNSRGSVVELTGLNSDAAALLQGYDGRGKDSLTVSRELIGRAMAMGFLSEGDKVVFTINTPDEVRFIQYGTALRQGVGGVTVEIYDSHTLLVTPDREEIPDDDDDDDDDD